MAGHPQAAKLKLTSNLPRSPGVYLFCGHRDEVLYVGKATNLRQRVRSYFGQEDRRRIGPMLREAQSVRHHCLPDPLSAEVVEARLIARLKPRYNRAGTRADRYCYVRLDVDSPWPRLAIVTDAGAHRAAPRAAAVAHDGDARRRGAAGRAAAAPLLGAPRPDLRAAAGRHAVRGRPAGRRRLPVRRRRRPARLRRRRRRRGGGDGRRAGARRRAARPSGCGRSPPPSATRRRRWPATGCRRSRARSTRTRQMADLLARGRFETTRGDVTWVVDHARLVDVRVAGSTAGALRPRRRPRPSPAARSPAPSPTRPSSSPAASRSTPALTASVRSRSMQLADAGDRGRVGLLRTPAPSASRAAAARPSSIDCLGAARRPPARSSATPATTRAAAALSTTMSRWAPCSPPRTRRTTSALCAGSPPTSCSWVAGARPSATGSTVNVRAPPSWSSASTVDGPVVVSSSSPPPWTTQASVEPWARSDASIRSAKRASATPISWRRTRPGLAIGPSRLNTVGMPISRRDGAAKRNAGWKRGAKQKPMPASSTQRRTPSGDSSRTTPSASSTSAVPHSDDAPRAPCLHTGTPAPATTMRRHRRHVDRVRAVAAGADDVDGAGPQVVAQRHQLGRRRARRRAARTARRRSRPWPAGRRRTRSAGPAWPARRGSSPSPRGPARPTGRARRAARSAGPASRRASSSPWSRSAGSAAASVTRTERYCGATDRPGRCAAAAGAVRRCGGAGG